MQQQYEQIIDELSETFAVKSFITDRSDFIFILESPHIQELKYGIPVAGQSGSTMSKNLFGEQYTKPLGLLVKINFEQNKNRKTLNKIGLLNVSEIPMQRKAYQNVEVITRYRTFFDHLETIRSNSHKLHFSQPEINDLYHVLMKRFEERLKLLLDRTCTIVPCGRVAQRFFQNASIKGERWQIIHDVPHPSYHSWSQPRYREKINEVREAFFSQL